MAVDVAYRILQEREDIQDWCLLSFILGFWSVSLWNLGAIIVTFLCVGFIGPGRGIFSK